MRMLGILVVAAVTASGVAPTTALSAENFIPKGYTYSPDHSRLPPLNSAEDRINLQADIYETNNYWRKREARETDSYMQRFRTAPDANPANRYIDY